MRVGDTILLGIFAVLGLSQAVAAQSATADELVEELDNYPPDWLTRRSAENGMDLTLDGKIWINADRYGDRDDYAVAASDLFGATGQFRQAWVRGYHRRNPDVAFRESKQLVHVDCKARKWSTELAAYYDFDGRLLDQRGPTAWQPVIPGTHSENWLEMICAE